MKQTPPLKTDSVMGDNVQDRPFQTIPPRQNHYLTKLLLIIAVIFITYGVYYWIKQRFNHDQKINVSHSKPVVVQVANVTSRDVPIYIKALGNVAASLSINIKTQVNGQLNRLLFKEGQDVQQGDILAEIDDRALQALVLEYEGQLQRDQALLENARLDLNRYMTLDKKNFVPGQTVDTQRELVKQYEGTVESDQGLLQNACVNLEYCKIKAPVSGRLGLQLVDPGNYVQTSDTISIVTLNVMQPISVIFSVPEDQLPDILDQYTNNNSIVVEAYDRSQSKHLQTGHVSALDNQIDPTTGMIKLKSIYENKPINLYPNQFVNVKLLLRTQKNALIIPSAAIQYGAQGPFVYVVNDDQTVKATAVKLDINLDTEETIVTDGLSVNQKIVIEGTDKIKNGVKVTIYHNSSSLQHANPDAYNRVT